MGSAGGSAPLAMTCSGPIVMLALSKYAKLALPTFTAPTAKRTLPLLSKSKSTSFRSVSRNGEVSYNAVAPSEPRWANHALMVLGLKKPG